MKTIKLRRRWAMLFAIAAMLVFALVSAGCGSGGGTQNAALAPLSDVTATTNPITRATENTVSDDAKTLAVRQSAGALVSLDSARAFDADLSAIRAAYPGVQTVQAKPTFDAKKIVVYSSYTDFFAEKWQAAAAKEKQDPNSNPDLTTGKSAFDSLIQKYDVVGIEAGSVDRFGQSFILTLGASVKVPVAAEELSTASASTFTVASPNALGSEPRANIEFALSDGGNSHVYTFSQYYGDSDGLGKVYLHTYTIGRGGGIREQISGTPPTE